jgi:cytochrome c biogenesis protein CcmG, thiol:disulfide interchange protein DsbE
MSRPAAAGKGSGSPAAAADAGPAPASAASAAAPGPHAGASARAASSPPVRPKKHITRFIIPLAAFIAIAAVLGVGIKNSRTVGVIPSPLIGKRAPPWSLPVLGEAGRSIGSKQLAGRWYVLNVWGSWCYACREEHEELLRISRSSSVPIIGIDWNDDDAQARDYLNNLGNPYTTIVTDHDGHVVVDWGVYGAPETFLVNPQGMVVYKQWGPVTPDAWKREFVSRLPAELAARRS